MGRNVQARGFCYSRPVAPAGPLIFDLDDTLIESFPTYALLHRRIAEELHFPVPTHQALIPYGRSWEETLMALWPGRDLARFVQRYDELADDHPYPAVEGVAAALEALRAAGHSLWIVTKRTRRRLAGRLHQAGLPAGLFDGIFPAESQPALKPSPACFAPVWQALGQFASDALYIGDRYEDRQAAQSAGIGFVAVLTGPEVALGFPGDLPAEQVLPNVTALHEYLEAR